MTRFAIELVLVFAALVLGTTGVNVSGPMLAVVTVPRRTRRVRDDEWIDFVQAAKRYGDVPAHEPAEPENPFEDVTDEQVEHILRTGAYADPWWVRSDSDRRLQPA